VQQLLAKSKSRVGSRAKKNALATFNPAWHDLSAEWASKEPPQPALERAKRDFSLRSK
jgi:hypothetical protein